MADKLLQVEIVSHEGRLWHGVGTSVQIPVVDGQLGILPGRQPLLAMLNAGTVLVTTKEGVQTFTVDSGFASIDSDFVTVVADHGTIS